MRSITALTHITVAIAAVGSLAACGAVARHVSEEATTELAEEVRDRVLDDTRGTSPPSAAVLTDALHAVVDREAASEDNDSSFVPSYAGLVDADDNGLDDDGRVEITVRRASTCLVIDGTEIRIVDGRC